MEPIEVQQIFTSSVAAKPSPVEHVTSPTSSTFSTDSPRRASFQSHSRTMSEAMETASAAPTAAPTRTNRFSLQFPVQPASSTSPTRTSTSPTRDAQPVIPETLASPTGPTDTTFLTAIATQERRVLELKEELQRAEADLNKLKKQWTQHEANKKRNDARRITKLQPLQTAMATADKEEDADSSSAWMQQEMERRKTLLYGAKSSSRTVFSGSRHTRTLSLLSPTRDGPAPAFRQPPPRKESLPSNDRPSLDQSRQTRPALLSRASTTPDLTTEVADHADSEIDLSQQVMDREMLMRTGKKMATELKDGLWTFWEDLRQATVGDEATQMLPPPNVRRQSSMQTVKAARKQTSKSSLRPSSRGSTTSKTSADVRRPSPVRRQTGKKGGALPDLADPGFWGEQGGLSQQAATSTPALMKSPTMRGKAKISPKPASIASNEAWDTWDDSPKDSRSSSAGSEANTLPSTVSAPSSPRPGSETPTKKDPIPWPALSKLGPKSLRRTASHLMQEWEKSLTPSPGQEFTGQEDYLGFQAEAAATEGRGRGS